MSNMGDSDLSNPIVRSVEKGVTPAVVNGNEMANPNDASEDARRNVDVEPKTGTNLDPDSANNRNSVVLRRHNSMSQPLSRSSSPFEQQSYEGFRPPANDSRGYYASALRRRELGSASPLPQPRRVALRLNSPSPPFVPASIHGDSPPRDRRSTSGHHTDREQDGAEIDEQSPPRYASSRSPPQDNIRMGPPSRGMGGYRGQTIERQLYCDRNQQAYTNAFDDGDRHMDPFENESDIYNDSLGGRTHYPTPSQLMRSGFRRDSPGPQFHRPGQVIKDDESEFGQRHQRQVSQSRRSDGNEIEGFARRRAAQFDVPRRTGQIDVNDEDDSLFVQDNLPQVNANQKQAAPRIGNTGAPRRQLFSHETFIQDAPIRAPVAVPASKKRKVITAFQEDGHFNQPGANLAPSRYSGDPNLNWGLNQDPPSVPQNCVSDAALLKRGLTRGSKEKVCKRGYGANDPENVNIVNMKEDGMSFAEIVESLNEDRVANGRAPSLSICGVTSRYNRTAPLLFAAEGKQFIPLSKRGKGQVLADGPLFEKPVWNDSLDLILAQAVKEDEKYKWNRVTKEFNRRTGKNLSSASVALRHTIL